MKTSAKGGRIQDQVPLSLGKPSLRRRLEAYYAVVAPQQLENDSSTSSWLSKFDKIYDKYGGSVEREAKLQRMLSKKYGTKVTLEIVQPQRQQTTASTLQSQTPPPSSSSSASVSHSTAAIIHTEDYYINPHTSTSGVLDMCHAEMDAIAILLQASPSQVQAANQPWLTSDTAANTTILERVEKCAAYLPLCDPQSTQERKRPPPVSTKSSPPTQSSSIKRRNEQRELADDNDTNDKPSFPVPQCFAEIAASATSVADKAPYNNDTPGGGPYSMLVRAMHERFAVRVMIRYGRRGIRGVVTGLVVAVDKHWNLILEDAQEVYSIQQRRKTKRRGRRGETTTNPREDDDNNSDHESLFATGSDDDDDDDDDPTTFDDGKSPVEREVERRRCYKNGTHRRRSLGQIMVRGDTIVLVYRATAEASQTHQTHLKSRYETKRRTISDDNNSPLVGTPAACVCIRRSSSSSSSKGKKRRRS